MVIAMPQATKHDKELRAALPAHGHTSKVSLEKSATKSQPPDLPHVQATGFELLSWVCGSSPAPTTLTLTCRHCFRKKKLKHPKVRGQSTTNQLTSGKRVNGHPGALPCPHRPLLHSCPAVKLNCVWPSANGKDHVSPRPCSACPVHERDEPSRGEQWSHLCALPPLQRCQHNCYCSGARHRAESCSVDACAGSRWADT